MERIESFASPGVTGLGTKFVIAALTKSEPFTDGGGAFVWRPVCQLVLKLRDAIGKRSGGKTATLCGLLQQLKRLLVKVKQSVPFIRRNSAGKSPLAPS